MIALSTSGAQCKNLVFSVPPRKVQHPPDLNNKHRTIALLLHLSKQKIKKSVTLLHESRTRQLAGRSIRTAALRASSRSLCHLQLRNDTKALRIKQRVFSFTYLLLFPGGICVQGGATSSRWQGLKPKYRTQAGSTDALKKKDITPLSLPSSHPPSWPQPWPSNALTTPKPLLFLSLVHPIRLSAESFACSTVDGRLDAQPHARSRARTHARAHGYARSGKGIGPQNKGPRALQRKTN